MADQRRYDVHLYAVVRVKVADVPAESALAAARKAYRETDLHGLLDQNRLRVPSGRYTDDFPGSPHRPGHQHVSYVEFADELSDIAAMVDHQNDPAYERSVWLDADQLEEEPAPCTAC